MQNKPIVSVILPCYNAEPFLVEALESIINQSFKDLEIICVDDGSTDATLTILNQYARNDKRIKVVINDNNLGLISTLNKAILLSRGEIIARMDADDISSCDRIEKQIDFLKANKHVDIVSTGYYLIDENGQETGKHLPKCYSNISCTYASFFITPITHACVLGKRSVFLSNPYEIKPNTLHVEDYSLWCKLLNKGYVLSNIALPLYKVRINSQSVSRKFETIQISNFIGLVQEHHEIMGVKPISRPTAQVLCLRINRQVKIKHIVQALKTQKQLLIRYLKKATTKEEKEILAINKYIMLSVLLQAIKRGAIFLKIFSLGLLILFTPIIINKKVLRLYFER